MRSSRSAKYGGARLRRGWIAAAAGVLLLAGAAAAMLLSGVLEPRDRAETVQVDGITIPANVGSQYLQRYRGGAAQDMLLKGVNMGIAKPGHFPGEAAITKAEYARWFREIGAMNANVVRVYTLHPPAFYEALLEYNEHAKHPLYVLHGIWMNEDKLLETRDVFDAANAQEFAEETRRIVDVIHGNADIPARPGHASGAYKADVSKYVLGWVIGVEWDPDIVQSTNAKHAGAPDYAGTYFRTQSASPFETWLAHALDDTIRYETDTYRWQRPISFTNWVTTDPLRHPAEPLAKEDAVSVDPNVVWPTPALKAGYFASYHVYPYYPDFLNYEMSYINYIDHRGEKNNYAGYLNDLKKAHRMPVVVAEFGVPSSRGMTHRNVSGWNQGFHSEKEQGEIVSRLFEDIYREGMAGGLVFTWQDEWFKRTWNNMDYDNPDRRPFWSNVQTSEQHFGLLSFDPGAKDLLIKVDGKTGDWQQAGIRPLAEAAGGNTPRAYGDGYDERRRALRLYMASDERYVYFRLDFGGSGQPLDWTKTGATILLDTVPGQGESAVPGGGGLTSDAGFDLAIDVKGPDASRVWVDSYYDLHELQYGRMLGLIPQAPYADKNNNGVFHKQLLTLNKELSLPDRKGTAGEVVPFESYETGVLRYGNADPGSPQYDSLTDVAVDAESGIVELRIPWQLLQIKDPGTHEATGDIRRDGLGASVRTPGFRAAVVTYKPEQDTSKQQLAPAGPAVADTLPAAANGALRAADMPLYEWRDWEYPQTHERLKPSYDIVKATFAAIDAPR